MKQHLRHHTYSRDNSEMAYMEHSSGLDFGNIKSESEVELQATQLECSRCSDRSDWEIVKTYFERDEAAQKDVQNLKAQIMQLEGHVSYAGIVSEKDRMALNGAHEELARLSACLYESEEVQASLENQLFDRQQEVQMLHENIEHERTRSRDTERELGAVWRSHTRLDEIMSKVEFHVDDGVESHDRMYYNITELVFETAIKDQLVHDMEEKLVQSAEEHRLNLDNIARLEEKLRVESAQHTEEAMLQDSRIRELAKLHQDEVLKVYIGGERPTEAPKPVKRRRNRSKVKSTTVKLEQTGAHDDGILPSIVEEV